ncbi:MAG: hypothetical protein ACRC2T_00355, partial [Thermoguttaceae bacterium]
NKNSISTERVFELRGYPNYDAAYTALLNNVKQYNDVESIDVEENTDGAYQLYTGRVKFLEEQQQDTGAKGSLSFEVAGSQTKITRSIQTRFAAAAKGSPRNYGGLIGVTDDGVEGIDIDTAVSSVSKTVQIYPEMLTPQFVAFLGRAYGSVNIFPFMGFDSGEIRFLGASGSYRDGDSYVDLTYKFAISPNAYDIPVGNMIVPFKYGWDYLWVRWANVNTGGTTVKIPVEVYVEQVYQGMHFGLLGLGNI